MTGDIDDRDLTPQQRREREHAREVAERRAKAGYPTLKPRNDFVGGPAAERSPAKGTKP